MAKTLSDKPFHLIATHSQRGTKEKALPKMKKHGWSPAMENFTICEKTQIVPEVRKTRFVPYYYIFDHTGKLRYHHIAGPWHEGDGDRYQERVKELVAVIQEETDKELAEATAKANAPLSELTTWTNSANKEMKASLLKVKEEKALFKSRRGKEYWYPLSKLSAESQKSVQKYVEEREAE